jgi:hypothetical protein
LEQMFGGGVPFTFVLNGMSGKVCEPVMRIMAVIE